ncbi:energy transducer TonB [Flavitalea flava]
MRIITISLFLLLAFLLEITLVQGQTETFEFFDAKWKPIKEKKAVYLVRMRLSEDTCWEYSFYYLHGPLIKIESYQDEQKSVRQGLFAWYNKEGRMDSSGYFYRGLPDKDWIYPDETWKIRTTKHYDKGIALTQKEFEEKLKAMEIIDPAYPDLSRLSPESYYPGGSRGWNQYLGKNFRYPDRAVNNMVDGRVLACFLIEPTGQIQDIQILQSVELSLDEETIRVLKNSSTWVPAIKFERKVRSFKIQPMIFKLDFPKRR